MSKEVEANVTSLWSSGHVTLAVHWLGVRECGVNTAMGGSFDLGRTNYYCLTICFTIIIGVRFTQSTTIDLERVPIEEPGAQRGVEFQS